MQASKLFIGAILLTGCASTPKAPTRMEGVANFREVGGYKTEDGHSVRHGLLYRSAQLSAMTQADRETLHRLGVRYEIDLRSEGERKSQPSSWGSNPPAILIPFHYKGEAHYSGEAKKPAGNSTLDVQKTSYFVMSPGVTPAQVRDLVKDATARIATERADEIGAVISALAHEDSPALLHCSGGKDRTGVSVAILMRLLGVPREEIYREYLRSNDQLEIWYRDARQKAQAAGQPYNVSFELFSARAGVDRSWLESAFQAIDQQYQSFDNYTQNALKLSPFDLQKLRARFLEG